MGRLANERTSCSQATKQQGLDVCSRKHANLPDDTPPTTIQSHTQIVRKRGSLKTWQPRLYVFQQYAYLGGFLACPSSMRDPTWGILPWDCSQQDSHTRIPHEEFSMGGSPMGVPGDSLRPVDSPWGLPGGNPPGGPHGHSDMPEGDPGIHVKCMHSAGNAENHKGNVCRLRVMQVDTVDKLNASARSHTEHTAHSTTP